MERFYTGKSARVVMTASWLLCMGRLSGGDVPGSTDGSTPSAPSASEERDGSASDTFLVIAKRNAFGIKPPPPQPPPETVAPPPPPPSNLFLTGISVIDGIRRAYLVQVEAAGKPPKYVTLDEAHGMRDGLRLLSIDLRKRVVRVQNGSEEMALNFKDNSWKGAASPGGNPNPNVGGPPGMRQVPQPVAPPQAATPVTQDGPTIIRRGGGIGRSNADAGAVSLDANGGVGSDPNFNRELPQRYGLAPGGTGLSAGNGASGTGNPNLNPNTPSGPATTPGSIPSLLVPPTRPTGR